MKVIGLTGGIGSGKSTVSQFLAELGATIIDADKAGHAAIKSGTEVWHEVVAAFGRRILNSNGEVDRKKLGEIVFGKPELLSRLNQIVHPRILEMVKSQIEAYERRGIEVVILEVPLLLEAGWASRVDEVWVTVAPESTVLARLKKRTGLSQEQALARIGAQMSNEERVKHADVVITTDCSLDELKVKVEELWEGLCTRGTGRQS